MPGGGPRLETQRRRRLRSLWLQLASLPRRPLAVGLGSGSVEGAGEVTEDGREAIRTFGGVRQEWLEPELQGGREAHRAGVDGEMVQPRLQALSMQLCVFAALRPSSRANLS